MTTPAKAARQAAASYALGFAPPKRRHGEATEFTVIALWLAGFSAGNIAAQLGMRRSQILGIAHRSPFKNRSNMTDAERQHHLDEMREIRFDDGVPIDGGALDRFNWRIIPLTDGRKQRPAKRLS